MAESNLRSLLDREFSKTSALFHKYFQNNSEILSDGHAALPNVAYSLIQGWCRSPKGIARLAENTGLDRLGIPTFYTVRPTALHPSVVVSSGKGVTRASAILSALFEAFERWSAEKLEGEILQASRAELSALLPDEIIVAKSTTNCDRSEAWTVAFDLINNRPCLVLVQEAVFPPLPEFEILREINTDTNGLAAGTNPLEAISLGVLELVERDAIRRINPTTLTKLATDSLPAAVKNLAANFLRSGVELAIVSCPSPTALPVIYCISRDNRFRMSSLFCSGSGASTNTTGAVMRALTEVAQSRVGFVAALRDDVGAKVRYYQEYSYPQREAEFQGFFDARESNLSSVETLPQFESFRILLDFLIESVRGSYQRPVMACVPLQRFEGLFAFRMYSPQLLGLSPNLCALNET